MKKDFTLKVPTPCSEKFKNFTKTENGGFCNSCNKEVIDFTKMTSQQIIEHFNKPDINTCGIFKNRQLTNYREKSNTNNRWQFRALASVTFSIISLFSANEINAQVKPNNTEIHQKKDIKNTTSLRGRSVKGIITDEEGPLPNVSILLEGTTIGTSTNFDGEFTFPKVLKKEDVLIVSYIGYKTERIVIKNQQLNSKLYFNVKLKVDSCVIMGKVATNKV